VSTLWVTGPRDAGPGERAEMLAIARSFLESQGVAPTEVVRIDVPGRGGGEEGEGVLRAELEPVIPMLQSGSLFGEAEGLMLVDANNLNASEASVVAELLPGSVAVAVVSEGSVPKALSGVLKRGETRSVTKIWESNAVKWLAGEIEKRGLAVDAEASQALIQRFGADTASLGQALDQLAEVKGKITGATVRERFRNRPNEPIFHYTDAVTKGDVAESLRRLSDLLVHQHPLVILAALERELQRRSVALSSPDIDTFRVSVGARDGDRWVERVWRQRGRLRNSGLRRGVDALVRADRVLKSSPEEMHRVTLERVTVAMCRWMVGK